MKNLICRLAIVSTLISGVCGCREEVAVFTDDPYLPVIYSVFCPDDSIINIKISRTFQGNQNAYISAQNPDTQFLKSLKVSIEFVSIGGQLYIRQEIPLSKLPDKDPGIFFSSPNYQFTAPTRFPYQVGNSPRHSGYLRLIVYDPAIDRYSVAESLILGNPKIIGPINPLGQYKVALYAESPLNVWYVDVQCAYTIQIRFIYNETFGDGPTTEKSVSWEIPVEYTGGKILDGNESKLSRLTIGGDDFYRKIGSLIQPNSMATREFTSFSITLFAYDPVLRQYEDIIESEIDIDPRLISNITNGMGVFACSRKTLVDSLRFDNRSLDSLCKGQFTRRLNFVKW